MRGLVVGERQRVALGVGAGQRDRQPGVLVRRDALVGAGRAVVVGGDGDGRVRLVRVEQAVVDLDVDHPVGGVGRVVGVVVLERPDHLLVVRDGVRPAEREHAGPAVVRAGRDARPGGGHRERLRGAVGVVGERDRGEARFASSTSVTSAAGATLAGRGVLGELAVVSNPAAGAVQVDGRSVVDAGHRHPHRRRRAARFSV